MKVFGCRKNFISTGLLPSPVTFRVPPRGLRLLSARDGSYVLGVGSPLCGRGKAAPADPSLDVLDFEGSPSLRGKGGLFPSGGPRGETAPVSGTPPITPPHPPRFRSNRKSRRSKRKTVTSGCRRVSDRRSTDSVLSVCCHRVPSRASPPASRRGPVPSGFLG